ncbi:MAG: hypothetical protein DLM63_01340 [Solirubrobacterales bacterium]|nr:MAG: hypothetical protein DLM63_01340 [Solirubrobacterales bacterium]
MLRRSITGVQGTANRLRWQGAAGHYEVYYLTFTDRGSGCGAWIRYTMLAPQDTEQEPSCALWFAAMDPSDPAARVARMQCRPISELKSTADPFELQIGDSVLSQTGARGGFEDLAWDLRWTPSQGEYSHVDAVLERAHLAQTILRLPQADLEIEGTLQWGDRRLELAGARGGQAHLWGSKHARRWCWMHASDLERLSGEQRPGSWVDAVSVYLERFGRELGPSTPVLGRIGESEIESTGPVAVLANPSRIALTGWSFTARGGHDKLVVEVDAPREQLVGVTYHDPDGELAYCYHTDVASVRVRLLRRDTPIARWSEVETLVGERRAQFEYAQREPVPGIELLVT